MMDPDAKVAHLEEENRRLKDELEKLRAMLQAQNISPKVTIEYTSDDGGRPEEMPVQTKPNQRDLGDDSEDFSFVDSHSGGEERSGREREDPTESEEDHRDVHPIERPYHSEDDRHDIPLDTPFEVEPPKDVLVSGLRLVPLFNTEDQCVEIVAQVVDDIAVPQEAAPVIQQEEDLTSSEEVTLLSAEESKKKRIRKGQKQRLKAKAQRGWSGSLTAKKRNKSNPNLSGYCMAEREIHERTKTKRLLRKQKKKNKMKKHPPRRGRHRRNPLVRAALEAADLLASVLPEGFFEQQEAEKAKDLKMKVYEELRKNDCHIELIDQVSTVEELLEKELKLGKFSAFYLVNIGACVEKYLQWVKLLPRVRPMYAVKSNPDINIVRTLQYLGAGFDCASQAELEEVLSIGAHPAQDIIFANPCKGKEHITFAKEKGIDLMTLDNLAELDKIFALHPNAQLVLRILPDDRHSLMPFGAKFGASLDEAIGIIKRCRQISAKLVGVSFHVGSGCYSSIAWHDAIRLARQVFDEAEKEGFKLSLLDIGGGYPGADDDTLTFEEAIDGIAQLLDDLFTPDVRIIAEPGRYFCTSCYTLAVTIISRRDRFAAPRPQNRLFAQASESHHESEQEPSAGNEATTDPVREVLYYLSDGLYGSFNNIVFDHAKPLPLAMKASDTKQRSTLFGPTCDSIDVICKDIDLPEMEIGDWLYFMNMGAYTIASASSFNGFRPPNARYLMYISGRKLVHATPPAGAPPTQPAATAQPATTAAPALATQTTAAAQPATTAAPADPPPRSPSRNE